MRKCKHPAWEVIGNDYVPGQMNFSSVKTHSTQDSKLMYELLEKQRLGTTTLTQRCKECGWIETSIVLGKVNLGLPPEKVVGV